MYQPLPNNQPPPGPYPPQQPSPKRKRKLWPWLLGSLVGVLVLCSLCAWAVNAMLSPPKSTTAATATSTKQIAQAVLTQAPPMPTPKPTATPTPKPTPTPQPSHYPPTTSADLHVLAAKGDANAIHEFHSESVGAVGVCPEPKRLVTVDPSITGQQLAQDLLAYFYTNQIDSPCGSVVFAYHTQSEAGDAYTAGRILFDTANPDGSANYDPNASNLKYKLTLDTGGVDTVNQEYVVTY